MRIMMEVDMPAEPFNTLVREGVAGDKLGKILETLNPEAAYFSERDGDRCCTLIVDMNRASDIPALAEPFFLNFNAKVKFRICMTPDDLERSGLDRLGQQWG